MASSLSDLDSYRATPAEIRERKEAHKSKNHISVKLEKMRKEKQRQRAGLSNAEARQVAILKEVLHDQQQLDSVLSKTDEMMAMVKDLFGDDAKKYTGYPKVTVPPGSTRSGNSSLPQAPEIHTRIEKQSESVMSTSALNDMSDSSDDSSENSDADDTARAPEPLHFQSRLDLQRFQRFLQEEENQNCNANALPSSASLSQPDLQRLQQLQRILLAQESNPLRDQSLGSVQERSVRDPQNHTLSTISGNVAGGGSLFLGQQQQQQFSGPAHSTQLLAELAGMSMPGIQTPPNSLKSDGGGQHTPPRSALNDTGKVKRSKRRVKPAESAPPEASSSLNMGDMRQVLESLQAEIADFERRTGRRSASDAQSSETFTGYTVALVTAVTKLTHYMKETELRLQAEMMVREQLAQDVRQLTVTIDSITQEIIGTQEEYVKLGSEFQSYRQHVQREMAGLQAQILELHSRSQGSKHSTPGKAASAGPEMEDESFHTLPDRVTQQEAATAVLLTPLVRKTRVQQESQPDLSKQRQSSLVDIPNLVNHESTHPQSGAASLKNSSTSSAPAGRGELSRPTQNSSAFSGRGDPSRPTQNSSALSGRGDPPRLTQTLPVFATVNVPRPIPLVQSNVDTALPGSQAAGPLSQSLPHTGAQAGPLPASHHSHHQLPVSGSATAVREAPRVMESQIAELSRQHAEAQRRLHSLLEQQKRQHDQLLMLEGDREDQAAAFDDRREMDGGLGKQGPVASAVSPSISPISHKSERFSQVDPVQRLENIAREIKIALPMADLEASPGSLNNSP